MTWELKLRDSVCAKFINNQNSAEKDNVIHVWGKITDEMPKID